MAPDPIVPPVPADALGEKTVPTDIPPLPVTIIGTGPGNLPPVGTVIKTPDSQPNLVISAVVTPVIAILVRFLNVYVGMVVGLLGTAMTSNAIPAPDFFHLLIKCMELALGGACVLSLKDLVTIFGRLEQKYPLASGSV